MHQPSTSKGQVSLANSLVMPKVYRAHSAGKVNSNLRQAGMRMSGIFNAIKSFGSH